jgi:prepilin-type processing-associated H-X9-DG protein/prepilin-type N-terminal cleavage/methylation domain-containing protein
MSVGKRHRVWSGFTLVELLVSMGIIATLMGMLMPAFGRARAQANLISCMSRERQLLQALSAYAAMSRGRYPPNTVSPSPGCFWNDSALLGIKSDTLYSTDTPGTNVGTIFTCPMDQFSVRTYAMNVWASSFVFIAPLPTSIRSTWAKSGSFWNQGVRRAPSMILLTETWSSALEQNGIYKCGNCIGESAVDPAARFGANGGVSPALNEGPWGTANSEVSFALHRIPSNKGGTQPSGRVNIGFADGHVATEAQTDLVNPAGQLTGVAYWSPLDFQGQ